jgi:Transposase DNA-binding/Transposase DDE domain
MDRVEARDWAREEFGEAKLGDARRTQRVVSMAATALARPAGRVLQVFQTSAERQGAYDLLENAACKPEALTDALGVASACRSAGSPRVFVSTDGSSLSLVDPHGKKGFGRIGSTKSGGRGLKVITSLAIDPDGAIIGVLDQQWWSRTSGRKRHNCHARALKDKETAHWVSSIEASKARLAEHAPDTRIWFLLDRENDRRDCLTALRDSGATYVVRSAWNRRLVDSDSLYLVEHLQTVVPLHEYSLNVAAGPRRSARVARMVVRATRVQVRLRDRRSEGKQPLEITVVEAREEGTAPPGETPIHWRLLTNHVVLSKDDADEVIDAYAKRWPIEEFHKTWKIGACNIEDSQLRAKAAMIKWAILMAAVAARIERLKMLSRTQPELPAGRELTEFQIRALIELKRRYKKRTETIPDTEPTLAQAIWWLAELGGYTGKSSGGPPGSIAIRRGLDYIAPAAALLEALENEGKLR